MSRRLRWFASCLLVVFLISMFTAVALAWKAESGNGTVGMGVIKVLEEGRFTFNYEVFRGDDHDFSAVQQVVVPYDKLSQFEGYLKIRSEIFVAAAVEEGVKSILDVKLQPGIYLFLYGPWTGISHDSPDDPGHRVNVKGPSGSFEILSEWAGDVVLSNPSMEPHRVGRPGTVGKISAVWDRRVIEELGVLDLFPNAKVVSKFGGSVYDDIIKEKKVISVWSYVIIGIGAILIVVSGALFARSTRK